MWISEKAVTQNVEKSENPNSQTIFKNVSDPRATPRFEEKHSRLRRGSGTHKTIARNT